MEIADESRLRPNFDMTSRATGAVNKDRTYRRGVRIAHRKFAESIESHQFSRRLSRKLGLGPR